MKLRLLMLGKTRREEARTLIDDYIARIRHYANVEVTELRDAGPAALRKLKLDSSATLVLLDAAGNHFTSQQFAKWLGDLRDRGTPARCRQTENLALHSYHATRIRPRGPRRADLPRLRDSRRSPLSEIAALLRKYRHVHQNRARQSRARLIR